MNHWRILRQISALKKHSGDSQGIIIGVTIKSWRKNQDVGQLLMKNHQSKSTSVTCDHPEEKSNKQNIDTPQDSQPREVGGPKGPEPTRYGDWERAGRCSDF